jgi:chorismate mutase/prephenate dehydrogenase
MTSNDLDKLRAEINQIDLDVLKLAQKRLEAAKKVGQIKSSLGLPTRDFGREKQCAEFSHRVAKELGLSEQFAERVLYEFIRESLTSQEKDRVAQHAPSNTRKALVIGGAGKMGLWFGRFLASQGFYVEIADPEAKDCGFDNVGDWKQASLDHDVIVVATPLSATGSLLLELAQYKPKGLVFDLSSLKEPVRQGLDALLEAGVKVTSLHPMFGPDTELLSGRHVILVDMTRPDANQEAKALFGATMASVVEMDIDEHDRVVAFLLGLSHALNIAFFSVLTQSGETAPHLMELSSTTFNAQLDIAARVAGENPSLYYEIQALNPYGDVPLDLLSANLASMRQMVRSRDERGFVELMRKGNDYLKSNQTK